MSADPNEIPPEDWVMAPEKVTWTVTRSELESVADRALQHSHRFGAYLHGLLTLAKYDTIFVYTETAWETEFIRDECPSRACVEAAME